MSELKKQPARTGDILAGMPDWLPPDVTLSDGCDRPRDPLAEARSAMARAGLDILPAMWPHILADMKADTMPGRKGWILCGGTGTGKTRRAKLAAQYAGVEMVTARQLYDDLCELPFWQASRIGSLSMIGRIRSSDLIIDDLGVEPQTATIYGNTKCPLADCLEERYAAWPHIRTYITTNLTMRDILERYGERVSSRLAEMCAVIVLAGTDRRTARQGGAQ